MIYNKKHIIIIICIKSDKSLIYQLISFIKHEAIILVILSTFIHMTNQVCFYLVLGVLDVYHFFVNYYSYKRLGI